MATKKDEKVVKKATVKKVKEEVKNEEVVVAEVVRTKADIRKDLRKRARDIEVEVLNMTNGEFFYKCRKTKEELNLMERGNSDIVTLDFLLNMKNQHRALLERLDLVIIDVYDDFDLSDILEYLGLSKIYEDEKYDVDYIEDAINDMDSEEFSNLVQNASIGLVVKIAERGIQLAKEGGFDSFFKRSCVAKRLGKEDIFDI